VYRQTQHFVAIQQCAACVGASEATSGIFFIEVKKHKSICNMQFIRGVTSLTFQLFIKIINISCFSPKTIKFFLLGVR
jgi:hypothetical protein